MTDLAQALAALRSLLALAELGPGACVKLDHAGRIVWTRGFLDAVEAVRPMVTPAAGRKAVDGSDPDRTPRTVRLDR